MDGSHACFDSSCLRVSTHNRAQAAAWVDTELEVSTASCTTTVTEKCRRVAKKVTVTTHKPEARLYWCLFAASLVVQRPALLVTMLW